MEWGLVAGAGAFGASVASLLAFLGSVPFGLRNFRGWRLRRLAATIDALNPDRHEAQRAVLEDQRDHLANLLAAAHRIPTPWKRYVSAAAAFGFAVGWTYYLWRSFDPARLFDAFLLAPFGTFALLLSYRWTIPYLQYVRRERERFIIQGCPARFASTRDPRAIRYIIHRRREQRSIQAAASSRIRSYGKSKACRNAKGRWLRRRKCKYPS